jgi:acyl-CoA thioester hydrolase
VLGLPDRLKKPMQDAAELWRGGVNTWECDEMGHMNVRFYVARAAEGLAGLARLLGMADAFTPHAPASLIVKEHHLRFLREAAAGAPLHMTGGVVEMDETSATVLLVLFHTRTGEPAATCLTKLIHAAPESGRAFPWPRRACEAAEALKVEVPTYAAPRSISSAPLIPQASLARANALGLGCAARGALRPQDCDVFGRMRAEEFIGRVSDGVPGLLWRVRQAVMEGAPQPIARVGGAVLEYRLLHLDWPRAGDHLELRSGIAGVEDKVQRLVHWLLDPVTGKPWGSAEAVAVNFDLDARKVIPISPEARAVLQDYITEGLTI